MDAKCRITRRDLISGAIGGAAALGLGRAVTKEKKADISKTDQDTSSKGRFFAAPKDTLVVVPRATVGIARCQTKADAKDMTFEEIRDTVRKAVSRVGGLEGVVKNGDRVVLKPNLMTLYINSSGEKLYPEMNGVTTDYRVTRAVAQLVCELNPKGKISVMESCPLRTIR
ncbi:MAG: hypothetical protein JSW59_03440 [Phycisphaerales bacterium]|nr:MAG: hypothetical protein JSW59_03440 [Phycisphaerales bacterium]